MKRKLVIRPRAELDLIGHCVYLAAHQPQSAAKLKKAARSTIADIKSNPRSGATASFETFPDIELRFRKPHGFKNYLIIYQVTDDNVVILRILHASQDIEAALRE